jgi:DNA-binding PadR family transcriptional regulator
MAIVSETKMKILTELKNNPSHGYELSKKIELPLTFIYQHLKEPRQAGLINSEEKGRKKIYHLTEKGELLLKILR